MIFAGTRVALGAGLGLLLAGRLSPDARKGAGWALLLAGGMSTIPIAAHLLGKPPSGGVVRSGLAPGSYS